MNNIFSKISLIGSLLFVVFLLWLGTCHAWNGSLDIGYQDGLLTATISQESDPLPVGNYYVGTLYVADWNTNVNDPQIIATDISLDGRWTVSVPVDGVYKIYARVDTTANQTYEYQGPEIFVNLSKYGSDNALPQNNKPLAMSAGFYGAAFVCNAGTQTEKGTVWVGEYAFPVVVLPGPCESIEFTGVNSVPMGYNYEVRVDGNNLSVYTVNVVPSNLGQVIIQ